MATLATLLTILHFIVCVFLIGVVLLQSGRGGGMGAAFGGGTQIFGGRGAGGFLAKLTTGLAIVFMLTSLTLSMLSSEKESVVNGSPATPRPADAGLDVPAVVPEQPTAPSDAQPAAPVPLPADAAPANP